MNRRWGNSKEQVAAKPDTSIAGRRDLLIKAVTEK
jgi:hypothetical protein